MPATTEAAVRRHVGPLGVPVLRLDLSQSACAWLASSNIGAFACCGLGQRTAHTSRLAAPPIGPARFDSASTCTAWHGANRLDSLGGLSAQCTASRARAHASDVAMADGARLAIGPNRRAGPGNGSVHGDSHSHVGGASPSRTPARQGRSPGSNGSPRADSVMGDHWQQLIRTGMITSSVQLKAQLPPPLFCGSAHRFGLRHLATGELERQREGLKAQQGD